MNPVNNDARYHGSRPCPSFAKPLRRLFREPGPKRPLDVFGHHSLDGLLTSSSHKHRHARFLTPEFEDGQLDYMQYYGVQEGLTCARDQADHLVKLNKQAFSPDQSGPLPDRDQMKSGGRNGSSHLHWAKKILIPFTRTKEKSEDISNQLNQLELSGCTTNTNPFYEPADDYLGSPKYLPARTSPHRKAVPRCSSLDSQLPDVFSCPVRSLQGPQDHNSSPSSSGDCERSIRYETDMRFRLEDNGFINFAGRGSPATFQQRPTSDGLPAFTMVTIPARHCSSPGRSFSSFPRPPPRSKIFHSHVVPHDAGDLSLIAESEKGASFSPDHSIRPVYLHPLYEQDKVPGQDCCLDSLPEDPPPRSCLDDGTTSEDDWYWVKQRATEKYEQWISRTPLALTHLSLRQVQNQERNFSSSRIERHLFGSGTISRQACEELNGHSRNGDIATLRSQRTSIPACISPVDASELEDRLVELIASRASQEPKSAFREASVLPASRGLAHKMLDSHPRHIEDPNRPPALLAGMEPPLMTEAATSSLGLYTDEVSRSDRPNTVFSPTSPTRQDIKVQASPEIHVHERQIVSYRSGKEALSQPRRPDPAAQSFSKANHAVTPGLGRTLDLAVEPQQGLSVNETASPSRQCCTHNVGVQVGQDDRSKIGAIQRPSLSGSQVELLNRVQAWQNKVGSTPTKKPYAPSASATEPNTVGAHNQTMISNDRTSQLTSISRRVEMGFRTAYESGGDGVHDHSRTAMQKGPSCRGIGTVAGGSNKVSRPARDDAPRWGPPGARSPAAAMISIQGPPSEVIRFFRGTMKLTDNDNDRILPDHAHIQEGEQVDTGSPPRAFGTRHIRQLDDNEAKSVFDLVGGHFSNDGVPQCSLHKTVGVPHKESQCPTGRKEADLSGSLGQMDSGIAPHGRRKSQYAIHKKSDENAKDGRPGLETSLNASTHGLFRKDPEILEVSRCLRRRLAEKEQTNESVTSRGDSKQSETRRESQERCQFEPSPAPQAVDAAKAQAEQASRKITKHMPSTEEVSHLQRTLQGLHKALMDRTTSAEDRLAIDRRLSMLEQAVFLPN